MLPRFMESFSAQKSTFQAGLLVATIVCAALVASSAFQLQAVAAENTTAQGRTSVAASAIQAAKSTQAASTTQKTNPLYRVYNPKTGEHLYTTNVKEKRVLIQQRGWIFEGIAWYAPKSSKTPVYRLYKDGAHHYTASKDELNELVGNRGWKSEGICWYSDDKETVPVHRVARRGVALVRTHHYTTDEIERDVLTIDRGWRDEGVAWYAAAKGTRVKDGWVKIDGKWTYWLEGKQLKGKARWVLTCQRPTKQSDPGIQRYYLNSVGHAVKGLFKVNGKSYYGSFTQVHVIHDVAKEINGKWYWANENGVLKEKLPYADRVPQVYQNPELPTGCESVALTMVLCAYGFSLKKTTIANKYMSYSDYDYVNHYVGNPYGAGAGIYAPGIKNTANRFLKAKGSKLRAHNVSGASFEQLLDYTKKGYPVLVWSTMYMNSNPHFSGIWVKGKQWYNYEHCVVMKGTSGGKVLVNDPLSGNVKRSYTAFRNLYYRCGSMAVVIW